MDYLDYMDEIYEELVEEFGHEIESDCIHKWYKSHPANGVSSWKCRRDLVLFSQMKGQLMTYQMSWERTRNVWDEYETDTALEINDYSDEEAFIETPDFDPLEIL